MDEINVDHFVYILERENNSRLFVCNYNCTYQSWCNTIAVGLHCILSQNTE